MRTHGGAAPSIVQRFNPDLAFKHAPDRGYLIWPRFLDDQLRPLAAGEIVPDKGMAGFWIASAREKPALRGEIRRGSEFWLSDGAKIVGEVEVVELLGGLK